MSRGNRVAQQVLIGAVTLAAMLSSVRTSDACRVIEVELTPTKSLGDTGGRLNRRHALPSVYLLRPCGTHVKKIPAS